MTRIFKLTLALLLLSSGNLFSQANLPTSWDISGNAPMGWTVFDIDFYSSGAFVGIAPPSAKFAGTGDYIEIEYNEIAGPLTYSITGSGNAPWNGTFNIEESVDGSTWTIMRQFTSGQLAVSNMTTYSDQPAAASRYVRFFYDNKVSGNNVGVDDISLVKAPAGPAQEINILADNGEQILSGGQAIISALSTQVRILQLHINNLGTQDTLTIDVPSSTITGTFASEFSFISNVTEVPPQDSRTLDIEFNPQAAGTRDAVITLVNNDADESAYVINVTGYGDHIATEPSQAATMNITQNLAYDMSASTNNPTAEGYIVLKSVGSPVNLPPVDKEEYEVGQGYGNAKVVYIGNGPAVDINEVHAGLDYHFGIYAFNGNDTFINYLQTGAQTFNLMSDSGGPGNYYNNIDPNVSTFIVDLHQLIRPHFQVYYSNYAFDYFIDFEERDTVGEQKVARCLYSGETRIYTPPFSFTTLDYSREHVYPQSWMPYSNNITDSVFYSDLYNLFTTRFPDVNELRSNFPLGEVDVPIQSFKEGVLGTSYFGGDTLTVYEPKDAIKGDAARAMMYMLVCYDRIGGVRWQLEEFGSFKQSQELLKKWNLEDPPSPFEKARNDFIASLQNNRNPFIDHNEWACRIDFYQMAYISNPDSTCGTQVGIDNPETANIASSVYPNPADNTINIEISASVSMEAFIEVFDLTGKKVIL
ncbi:MAG: hypothetical protein HKN92_09320, partial [Chitinophagales bacterium]|nr:hypothetical protein [Chitinophagales bacterium]